MIIRPAAAADAAPLTALAMAAKALWGYDAAFLEACRAELTVTEAGLAADPTFVLDGAGRRLGFYQLRLAGERAQVWYFFVDPAEVRAGLGRRLWRHLEDTARTHGATRLAVDADPNAEGFYAAMGMIRCGDVPSGSIPGRRLPYLEKALRPD